MKKIIALLSLIPSLALAQVDKEGMRNLVRRANNGNVLIDAQDLTTTRSFTVSPSPNSNSPAAAGYGLLIVYAAVTDANDSVTDLTMTCTANLVGSSTAYKLQTCAVAAGTCTSSNSSWSKNTSSSENFAWRVDVEGFEQVVCTFTPTGGAGADLITVYGGLAVKGS